MLEFVRLYRGFNDYRSNSETYSKFNLNFDVCPDLHDCVLDFVRFLFLACISRDAEIIVIAREFHRVFICSRTILLY